MPTTIAFIGLMILVNYGPNSAELVVGTVPGMMPGHDTVIVYNEADLVGQENWPMAGRVIINNECYDYVRFARENITFAGSQAPFTPEVEEMFHLSCCCQQMTGVRPEYLLLGSDDRAAAHVIVDHGLYADFDMPNEAKGTQVVFDDDPAILTIVADAPGQPTKRLKFRKGSLVFMANTPLPALSGYNVPSGGHDFMAYYNMGSSAATCNNLPSDTTGKCTPTTAPCKGNSVGKAPLTAAQRKVLSDTRRRLVGMPMVGDINCSGSAWP